MEFAPTARRVRAAFALAALATAMFVGWIWRGFGGELTTLYVDDVATILAALAASVLCFHAGLRHTSTHRRYWWLLCAACSAWTFGEVVWAVYDLVLRTPTPVPSWADLGYLGAIPFAVAALLSHPAVAGPAARQARFAIDGLLVATALLFLSWTFVLGPLWHSSDLTTLGGLVALAYPFGDVVIVFFVVLAVRRMPSGHRLALWCLLGGVLTLALSDSAYAYLAGVQGYETAGLLDTGWFVGYLAIAVGAFCSHSEPPARHAESRAPSLEALIVPFLPVVAALGVVALEPELVQELNPIAFATAFALVAQVLARQLLVLRDVAAHAALPAGGMSGRVHTAELDEQGRSVSPPARGAR